MKYFYELSSEQQEQCLDKIQNLPLFVSFREGVRQLLLTSKTHLVDDKLTVLALASEVEVANKRNSIANGLKVKVKPIVPIKPTKVPKTIKRK